MDTEAQTQQAPIDMELLNTWRGVCDRVPVITGTNKRLQKELRKSRKAMADVLRICADAFDT